jgi:hypothetical protein
VLKQFGVLVGEPSETGRSEESIGDALLAVVREPATRRDLVTRLFPGGVPYDRTLFDRLAEVREYVSYARSGSEAVGLIWSEAIRELPAEAQQAGLRAYAGLASHELFEHLDGLWVVIRDHEFPASFLADWLGDVVRVVERDMLQDGAWAAIRVLSTHHVDVALDVLRLLPTPADGTRLNIAGFMLGVLRVSGLQGERERAFREIETFFRDHPDARLRSVFNWS